MLDVCRIALFTIQSANIQMDLLEFEPLSDDRYLQHFDDDILEESETSECPVPSILSRTRRPLAGESRTWIVVFGARASALLSALIGGSDMHVEAVLTVEEEFEGSFKTSLDPVGESVCDSAAFVCSSPERLGHDVLLVLCKQEVKHEHAVKWSRILLEELGKPSRVFLMTEFPRSQFDSPSKYNEEFVPELFSFKTSRFLSGFSSLKLNIPSPLPAPNLVSGLPAALMSRLEILQIPALMAVVITDPRYIEESSLLLASCFAEFCRSIAKLEIDVNKEILRANPLVTSAKISDKDSLVA